MGGYEVWCASGPLCAGPGRGTRKTGVRGLAKRKGIMRLALGDNRHVSGCVSGCLLWRVMVSA
jgi:hypothetical protein